MRKGLIISLFMFVVGMLFLSCGDVEKRMVFDGRVQGTYYHIIVYPDGDNNLQVKDLQQAFDSMFALVDNTLSLWVDSSLLNRVNANEDCVLNKVFIDNFLAAKEFNLMTDGALDITIGAIVRQYGFANKDKGDISDRVIDSMMQYVGMDNLRIENNRLVKKYPQTQLDFNAIAQGYTTDIISRYLDDKGFGSYLVDVGGEVFARGLKPKDQGKWVVAIEKPAEDKQQQRSANEVIYLKDKSIVTSGNYRKYYLEDGVKYSHTIDPKTGKSVRDNLLSASVIADDATTADALATACMVMGLERSKEFAKAHKEFAFYLIFGDDSGDMQVWYSDNFKQYLVNQ